MKCPYCIQEIDDEAISCTHCQSNLSFYQPLSPIMESISELEEEISRINAFVDIVRPTNQRLDQPSPIDARGDQTVPTIITAAKFVIGNLTSVTPKWNRIISAVLLTALFVAIGIQLSLLLRAVGSAIPGLGAFGDGMVFQLTTVPGLLIAPGLVTLVPLILGFWTALAWPGRGVKGYMVLSFFGFLAGLLAYIAGPTLNLLMGLAGLPSGTDTDIDYRYWYGELRELQDNLSWTFVTYFLSTTLLFVVGGSFGYTIKPKRFSERKQGLAYRLLNIFTRRDKTPNPVLVKYLEKAPAIVAAILAALTEHFAKNLLGLS